MDNLSKNILSTIIYYDVQDYPLTSFEIWKYLITFKTPIRKEDVCEYRLTNIIEILDSSEFEGRIEKHCGFYFLPGRKNLVKKRLRNNKISEVKFKKILRIGKILKYCPFVRMIAITGTVAMKNAKKSSDLDFLVAMKAGHIFTGRFLFTALVHGLGMRRYSNKITNRACLNHFITDKTLEICLQDLFSSSEYSFIFPIFGKNIFKKFQISNLWIKNFSPNYTPDSIGNLKLIDDSLMSSAIRKIGEYIFDFIFIEKQLKKWQTERIINDSRTHKPGSIILADDDAMIFLPEPQGPNVEAVFQNKMRLAGHKE